MNSKIKELIQLEKEKQKNIHSDINVQEILDAAENVDTNYLAKHTLQSIAEEIVQILIEYNIDNPEAFCNKLVEYRYIDAIYQLHKGKHIRWIRIKNVSSGDHTLTNGGILVDVKFTDDNIQILCKNKNRFFKYNFDDCLTFQKLSPDEQFILTCYTMVDDQ